MHHGAILGAAATLLLLLGGQDGLVRLARNRSAAAGSGHRPGFWSIIITGEDGRYSLSRLQMYLWTLTIATAFVAAFLQYRAIPVIPENLYLLMGVNLAASVVSTAINTAGSGRSSCDQPDFVRDIFLDDGQSLDLPRSQMFVWTAISLFVFVVMFVRSLHQADGGSPSLPDIPGGMVVLMGISQGAYLGAKAASRQAPNP